MQGVYRRRSSSSSSGSVVVALLVSVACLSQFVDVAAMCSITQHCHTGQLDSKCHGEPSYHAPSKPDYPNLACPQYSENACCNKYQNEYLTFNFFLIETAFGLSYNNGCPACAQNLKRLWCTYSCSPDQADFVTPLGVANVSDPANGGVITEVLHTVVDVDTTMACSMYASCAGTGKCRTVETLKTCKGFLDYQGTYGAISRGNWINWNFTDSPKALNMDVDKCSNYTKTGTNETAACACSACRDACIKSESSPGAAAVAEKSSIDPLHGADWLAVGLLYAGVAVVSVGLVAGRWFWREHQRSKGIVRANEAFW